jgi:methionyl-tRNA synthetase
MKPWVLSRDERKGDSGAARQLDIVLWDLTECLRLVAEALRPFLPETAGKIASQLGLTPASNWIQGLSWGGSDTSTRVSEPTPLFPRRES